MTAPEAAEPVLALRHASRPRGGGGRRPHWSQPARPSRRLPAQGPAQARDHPCADAMRPSWPAYRDRRIVLVCRRPGWLRSSSSSPSGTRPAPSVSYPGQSRAWKCCPTLDTGSSGMERRVHLPRIQQPGGHAAILKALLGDQSVAKDSARWRFTFTAGVSASGNLARSSPRTPRPASPGPTAA